MFNEAFYEPQPRMCSRFFAISIYLQRGGVNLTPPPLLPTTGLIAFGILILTRYAA